MPRTALPALALLVVVVAACARSDDGGRGPAATCDGVLRLPGDELVVKSAGLDGAPGAVEVDCAKPACLQTRDDAVAVVQRDGTTWATWQGRAGAVLDQDVEATTDLERWARALGADAPTAAGERPVDGQGPPTLPKELRTCGTTRAGGGLGWHVIRNAGDVWQRIHWSTPPRDDDVRALPPAAYPLATGTGALCGWAVQTKERAWRVTHEASGVVVDAKEDFEHPPARCEDETSLRVQTPDGWTRVAKDGARTALPDEAPDRQGPPGALDVRARTGTTLHAPKGELLVHAADASAKALALPADRDLGGEPLPAGTTRERVTAVGDGAATLLVIERFALPSCAVREAVHVVRADDLRTTTIARGDVLHLRPSYALDRYWWVEATPKVVDVAARAR